MSFLGAGELLRWWRALTQVAQQFGGLGDKLSRLVCLRSYCEGATSIRRRVEASGDVIRQARAGAEVVEEGPAKTVEGGVQHLVSCGLGMRLSWQVSLQAYKVKHAVTIAVASLPP